MESRGHLHAGGLSSRAPKVTAPCRHGDHGATAVTCDAGGVGGGGPLSVGGHGGETGTTGSDTPVQLMITALMPSVLVGPSALHLARKAAHSGSSIRPALRFGVSWSLPWVTEPTRWDLGTAGLVAIQLHGTRPHTAQPLYCVNHVLVVAPPGVPGHGVPGLLQRVVNEPGAGRAGEHDAARLRLAQQGQAGAL